MKVKIVNNKRNGLLKRNEVIFTLSHEGAPTPSRIEVREELARFLKTDVENVYVKKMKTMTGTMMSVGEAHIYDSPEQARRIEPKYILLRNSPQENREEG